MNILVLSGSPRAKGNTKQMVDAFREGAEVAGHLFNFTLNTF
ncbi:MAG: NAD(P)H-dependent oxidoreductase [Lachnospiraceae bacterium]|nr:NAD(P)H-dependent oxidoreductase [Lachnospiraceae bacterium]